MSKSEASFRSRIDRELRRHLTDGEWELLRKRGYLEDFESNDDMAVDEAVEFVRDVRRSQEPAARRAANRTSTETVPATSDAATGQRSATFVKALSENVAAIASDDEDVVAFREEHLPNGLLDWADVSEWVTDHWTAQGGDDGAYTIVSGIPEPGWNEDEAGPVTVARVLNVSSRQLTVALPGQRWARSVSVRPGGVLSRLCALAEGLAAAHGWDAAQAATFVLTGLTPVVGLIRVTEGGTNVRHGMWCAWNERINLDVHPSASPEEVTEAYRSARQRLDRERTGGRRVRALSSRQSGVAAFVARRDASWHALMDEWNALCKPSERYSQVSNFRRDARLAQERVLYRGTSRPE